MQLLHETQLWAIARARQEELIREAAQARLTNAATARPAAQEQRTLWQRLSRRAPLSSASFRRERAPELG
jgi:hypothetical protein